MSTMDVLAKMNNLAAKISPLTPPSNISNTAKADSDPPSPTNDESDRSMNSSQSNKPEQDQPDGDAIKMFVGQIPRTMDENDLRKMFEEFGQVYQINVLRDKASGQSKGCCFVTFYTRKSALDAQNALHNIKTMAGMHHPIQMKPADSENRNERKLFVGMLSKKCSENDVRHMFANFGAIEECTVLRDPNGQSKGCAFVTYASRQCAINAIKSMHHSQTMEGCSSPLVVKFADTQKEKDQKRIQQMSALWNVTNLNLSTLNPQYLALLQQATPSSGSPNAFANLAQLPGVNSLNMQQLAALAAAQSVANNAPEIKFNSGHPFQGIQSLANQGLSGLTVNSSGQLTNTAEFNAANLQSLAALANFAAANPSAADYTSILPTTNFSGLNPLSMQNLAALAAASSNSASLSGLTSSGGLPVTSTASHPLSGLSGVNSPSSVTLGMSAAGLSNMAAGVNGLGSNAGNGPSLESLTQAYSGIQQYAAFPSAFAQTNLQQASSPAGKQIEGPDGANLFIYHLPQEFGDNDLAQTFQPFGNVVSAKVFIDKQTNLSKCFGFVSYDNSISAQAAIHSMNGFQIGMKRLKVQLKRSKDKPY